MINKDKIALCSNKVITLAEYIDNWAKSRGSELVVTSGFREGVKIRGQKGFSWHCVGLAFDFCFKDLDVFAVCSELYKLHKSNYKAFAGATEFEVCRNATKQHIHIAFGSETSKEYFTGIYV